MCHLTLSLIAVLMSSRQVEGVAAAAAADGFRGEESRVIDTPGVLADCNGIAVSVDGSTLLVSDYNGGSHAIHVYRVADGSKLREVGKTKTGWSPFRSRAGDGRLEFHSPCQVWAADDDDTVFVAEYGNNRVQVLTPTLDFRAFIGQGRLDHPAGVCANADVVVVSECSAHRIAVFNRGDGALLRRFGSEGSGDGQLNSPNGVCFLHRHRHVAVADLNNNRVSVFSIDGEFVGHVGVGHLDRPHGVAVTAHGEFVVADYGNRCLRLFSARGDMLRTMGDGEFVGVTVHRGTVFAVDRRSSKCIVFE
jgi:DNA-binding beta-propeller fold protein YncE